MALYTKTTDFASKDSLITGDPDKVIRGTEIDTEFENIETSIATQDGVSTHLTSVSGTNTITASVPVSLSAYATGQKFSFSPANTNTGAVTINIASLGAKAITKHGTTALVEGDLLAGAMYTIAYDGTRFVLMDHRMVVIAPQDYGAVGDGTTDDSVAFNKASAAAAAANALLYVPKPATAYLMENTWLITDDNPYGACDGLSVFIASGTTINQTTTPSDNFIIEIDGVTDVTIDGYNATIDGKIASIDSWPAYGTTALASAPAVRPMSIAIGNSTATSNITIKGLYLKDAAQDNIYVRNNATNVRLIDVRAYGAGRNNLSVISATDFYAGNCRFENARQWFTDDFGYGVDCEPAAASDVLNNITFENCRAYKNYDGGFYVLAANLDNTSTTDVSVRFINCYDDHSGWDTDAGDYHASTATGFGFYGPATSATISSYVDFIGCTSTGANAYAFAVTRYPGNLGSVRINKCHAEDWNRLASSSSLNVGAIVVKSLSAGTQQLAVHVDGTAHKSDTVAGEYVITYGNGQETYENFWLGEFNVSGSLNPRSYGIAGITASNMLGSASIAAGDGPKRPFSVMPSGVWVTGTSTQSINNNSTTKLTIWSGGTESGSGRFNFGRDFSLTNGEWTPKEPGLYSVNIRIKFDAAVDNSRVYVALFQDPATGSFAEHSRDDDVMIGTGTNQDYQYIRLVLVPATGYKYDVRVLQVSGGAINAVGASCDFMAVRVA